jgi:peptide/nickel transport system ATP-binding protein
MTVGAQIEEALRLHRPVGRRATREAALKALEDVRIRDIARVHRSYPHELSGGMGQRVMIAMMLIAGPAVLIADEPTSALDVAVQLQVLAILEELVTRRGMGLILISHDLELVASFCDRILVMYAGRIVETLRAADLAMASHPYTQGLLACLPRLDRPHERLATLQRDPSWAA